MGKAFAKITAKGLHLVYILLIIFWLLEITSGQNTTNNNANQTQKESCKFPDYFQTSCEDEDPRICKWNVGKRYGIPLWENPYPSDFRSLQGSSQFEWSVENSTIFIRQVFVTAKAVTVAKIVHRMLKCIKNISRQSNAKFIISVQKSEKSTETLAFSCIEFIRRGLNVVSYKISDTTQEFQDDICTKSRMSIENGLLIADRYSSLPDCPYELRGAFNVINVFDAQSGRNCTYKEGMYGLLESDCLSKEGIYIDLRGGHNCSGPELLYQSPLDLNLRCYSEPWSEGSYSNIIAVQRPRWLFEFRKSEVMCLKYKQISKETVKLHIFNDPVCGLKTKDAEDRVMYTLVMDRMTGASIPQANNFSDSCKFPKQFRDQWIEESKQNGINRIQVDETKIVIPPYGTFHCDKRFLFSSLPRECGFAGAPSKWLGQGHVRYFFDDYMLVSRFDNGCRDRVTRLGFTNTVANHIMVYRLSQSEPVDFHRWRQDEYSRRQIMKRFCNSFYIYLPDPYPYWGRNIEKVLTKPRLPNMPIGQCSALGDTGQYNAISTTADKNSCSSRIQFGCKKYDHSTPAIDVIYSEQCNMDNITYTCLGEAYKLGRFVLLRDSVTLRVSCAWRDKESHAIYRLDSPQCSDIDWGRWRGHAAKYTQKFELTNYEKCPSVSRPITEKTLHNSPSDCCKINTSLIFLVALSFLRLHLFS